MEDFLAGGFESSFLLRLNPDLEMFVV